MISRRIVMLGWLLVAASATLLGAVVLAVYSFGTNAPQTATAREEYCAYVRDALDRLPSVRDVVIWNEPNKSLFWSPQLPGSGAAAAPVAYEALLARCYDVLHAAFPDVNVIGLAQEVRPRAPALFTRNSQHFRNGVRSFPARHRREVAGSLQGLGRYSRVVENPISSAF